MKKEIFSKIRIDFGLLMIVILLASVSCIAIATAQKELPSYLQSVGFVKKQIFWYVAGAIIASLIMIFDFDQYRKICWYLYGFGMVLLIGLAVHIPGALTIKGATAWYGMGGLGNFQPSELMKIFLILTLGHVVAKHHEEGANTSDLRLLGKIFAVALPPTILVLKEPDLGQALVMTAIVTAILLVSGIDWRYLLGLALAAVIFIAILAYIYFADTAFFTAHILKSYQLDRFYGWLAPYKYKTQGYQLTQALLAAGSGGVNGISAHGQGVYFPEPHTDFIFIVVCEHFGFIGATLVISLFFLLIYRMIHTGIESNEQFGTYICAGVIGMFTFQVFENIGMTIGLMPITGITLPFLSYGGSSLVSYLIGAAFVMNIYSRTRSYMFE
ncbi:FtsW/RodA/SpoVE family cell cycle protein [Ectobacillus panaciterrae]|uniref:FtsW/RodA/SpoVE family cell cycle protein n=1 Tax=Ectobacillus panaciterrae TaxID=363872 RepID=UPI0003F51A25|nr:FtsW/RodA/SpoVE family cell cycle protein [Ectobacillus panaciterrae]